MPCISTRSRADIKWSARARASSLLTDWRFSSPLFRGTCNGRPFCLQLERIGLRFHLAHNGTEVDAMVMTVRAAELLARMKPKPKPDLGRFLLAPMPGLLTHIAVQAGQQVKAGERLAVIEAMKMENILRAEADATVGRAAGRSRRKPGCRSADPRVQIDSSGPEMPAWHLAQRAVHPPSITTVWPVIKAAAGEARNTTEPATSMG